METTINYFQPQIAFHPGETLEEKLEELGMGSKEFAIRTNKPEKTISAILSGKSSITPEMAVLFEHVLKIPAHFWLNMQRSYDEYIAREELKIMLAESISWAKKFPFADMVSKGWLNAKSTYEEKTSELLAFFSLSNHTAWENYYFKQQLKVAFRISLAQLKEPYAISAWLRQGEILASQLATNPYNEKGFKEILPEIKKLMVNHPENFFEQLQAKCASVGVKVVYTPCISKAPISGSTRWINDIPLIQLSGRYNRNDSFWFTFFHEAGHILLHGKKEIFLEQSEYADKDDSKEIEADNFAVKWTLKTEQETEIIQNMPLTDKQVIDFATKFETHPALIIGRLQHKKLLPKSAGRKFIKSLYIEKN